MTVAHHLLERGLVPDLEAMRADLAEEERPRLQSQGGGVN